jgi:hypothetical protein
LESLKKSKTNPFHKSKYIEINGVLDIIKPKLEENNVLLLQPHESDENGDYVLTKFLDLHDFSEVVSKTKVVYPGDGNPQKYGSAITYARRYGIISTLCLEQEDDDGSLGNKPCKDKKVQRKEYVSKQPEPVHMEVPPLPDNLEQRAYDTNVNYQAGEHLVQFGKYDGKKINQIDSIELQKTIDYWLEKFAKEGGQPKGKLKLFLEEAQSYLNVSGDGIPF